MNNIEILLNEQSFYPNIVQRHRASLHSLVSPFLPMYRYVWVEGAKKLVGAFCSHLNARFI